MSEDNVLRLMELAEQRDRGREATWMAYLEAGPLLAAEKERNRIGFGEFADSLGWPRMDRHRASLLVKNGITTIAQLKEIGGVEAVEKMETTHEPRPLLPPPAGQYNVIYADPPWRYDFVESPNRAIENHYPTMALEDIAALDVPAADDAMLFLWTTAPKLHEAFTVMAAWGFEYRTSMVWVKTQLGMGKWLRNRHEHLLIARKGKGLPCPRAGTQPDSVLTAPRTQHSAKPDAFRRLIEEMTPNASRIELFARGAVPGWDVWGNEADAGHAGAASRGDRDARTNHDT